MKYVVGFMFSADRDRVALILKNKPAWQRGKLNGIGGKVEPTDASDVAAMVREFKEETGCDTTPEQWKHFCAMRGGANDGDGKGFEISFFATTGELSKLQTMESETVVFQFVDDIHPLRKDVIENVPWLVPLALDFLNDGRPQLVIANYP